MAQEHIMGTERISDPPMPGGLRWEPPMPHRDQREDVKTIGVETQSAVKVKVRANVLEVLKMDQVQETCTVIFTLHLYYTDPLLKDFARTIIYSENGQAKAVKGVVTGTWGYEDQTMVVIKVGKDPPECAKGVVATHGNVDPGETIQINTTNILHMEQPDWELGPFFKPRWTIMNLVDEQTKLLCTRDLQYCDATGGHVFEKHKYKAVISERFDLKLFPFDRQLITIRFVAEDGMDRVQFAPLDLKAGKVKHGPRLESSVPAEWRVREDKPAELRVLKPDEEFRNSRFDVVINLERKPQYYLMNVPLVLFFITLATAPAYLLEPQDIADRAAVFLAVLFATGGYQLLTANWMPVKPYLTFMNKYILANFLFQVILMVESAVVVFEFCIQLDDQDVSKFMNASYEGAYLSRTPPSYGCREGDKLANIDRMFAYVMYALWCGWHLLFLLIPRFAFKMLMWKPAIRDEEEPQTSCTKVWRYATGWRYVDRLDWDSVYKENRVPKEYLQPTTKHPYGVIVQQDGPCPTLMGRTNSMHAGSIKDLEAGTSLVGKVASDDAGTPSVRQGSEHSRESENAAAAWRQVSERPQTSQGSGTLRLHMSKELERSPLLHNSEDFSSMQQPPRNSDASHGSGTSRLLHSADDFSLMQQPPRNSDASHGSGASRLHPVNGEVAQAERLLSNASGASRLHTNDEIAHGSLRRDDLDSSFAHMPPRNMDDTDVSHGSGAPSRSQLEVWSRTTGEWVPGHVEGGKVLYTVQGKRCRKSMAHINEAQELRWTPAV